MDKSSLKKFDNKYLIETLEHNRSNGILRMFWGPDRTGYTYSAGEAGLYEKEEAEQIVRKANAYNSVKERMLKATDVFHEGKHGRVIFAIMLEGEDS